MFEVQVLLLKKRAQQCLTRFLWCGHHFGTCESLGSSLVKMSQAFHDPSICFNFSYFHPKVNTFKTPEMCLYLDSDVWAGCFTIIFAGSFHYFKLVSRWFWFCENITGIPVSFVQLPSHVVKVNTIKTPEMRLYFDSDVWGRCLTIIFVESFPYFKVYLTPKYFFCLNKSLHLFEMHCVFLN